MNQETTPLLKETILIILLLFFSLMSSILINLDWAVYHLNCFSFFFPIGFLSILLFRKKLAKNLPAITISFYLIELIFHSVVSNFILSPSIFTFNFLYLVIFIFFNPFKNKKVLPIATLLIILTIFVSFLTHRLASSCPIISQNYMIYFTINGFFEQISLIIFFVSFYDYGDIAKDNSDRKFTTFDVRKIRKYLYLVFMTVSFYGTIFYFEKIQSLFYCNITYAGVVFIFMFTFHKIKSYQLSISLLHFFSHLLLTSHIFFSGGVYSPSLYFYLILPISSLLLQGRKYAYIWIFLCFESHLFISIMTFFGVIRFQVPDFIKNPLLPFLYSLGILFCFFFFIKHQLKKESFS